MSKHGRRRPSRRGLLAGAAALAIALVAFVAVLAPCVAVAEDTDLITGATVVAQSSEDASYPADNIVDGNLETWWISADMKTSQQTGQDQTPQWVVIDLGESFTSASVSSVAVDWRPNQVWGQVYSVETSKTYDGDATQWTTVAHVERDAKGIVNPQNAEGQDIANGVRDTFTATSNPSLEEGATLYRFVRLYIEKVNEVAPGNNTNVCDLHIMGTVNAEEPEEPVVDPWNVAQGRPATASSEAEGTTAANAVDGGTSTSWNSDPMKSSAHTDTTGDAEAQTEQWLCVDLGTSGTKLSSIQVVYKNNKVWAQAYRVETTDDDPTSADAEWTVVADVDRASANGFLTQGADQDIADPNSYTDTITTSSKPALQQTTLGRYVRLYIEKTNWQAPGTNINIAEFIVNGVNDLRPLSEELDALTAETVYVEGNEVVFPDASDSVEYSVYGSELENVITNDGTVTGQNMGSRDVTIIVRASRAGDPDDYAQKNLVVTVPDNSSSAAYASMIPSGSNEKPEVVPTIQEWAGGNGSFVLADGAQIVLNDAAGVGLSGVADNMIADVAEISGIELTSTSGASPVSGGVYIETLADESDPYALGDEGYLLKVSEDGIQIYANTYTGAIYGTITVEQILWQAEDHASVPCGLARDYPAYEVRGVKLDIARTPYRYEQLEDYAKIMLWYKMSEYDLHINDNDNANVNGATFDTHSGFHRIESDTFPSLAKMSGTKHAGIPQDLVNADYYNNNEDYQGNPTYTKDQWRALTELSQSYGMNLLTEIDLPGHSLLYNKYAEENPDNISWLEGGTMLSSSATGNSGYLELLDLTGENKDRALQFAKTLWDEYTDPENPTIYGNVIGIGSDEYWVHNNDTYNAFANFANEMRKVIQGNLGEDVKVRMWGAGTASFSTAESALNMTSEELAEHFQLDIWYPGYDNAKQRVAEGYDVVNCRDAYLYGNPGRTFRDVPAAEYLFNEWNPAIFDSGQPGENTNTLVGDPHLLGAKAVIWGDQSQEGMTERDVHQRVLRAIAIVSEKSWGGTEESDTFDAYELRASRLAEGPGTSIAMDVESESSLVASYDFDNVTAEGTAVLDASGNGYTAALDGVTVEDGWASFDGEGLMTTEVKTVSYPYTVSFDLRLSADDGTANTEESSLFSGYDGRIQVAGHNGNMSADVNYFTRDFGYKVPTDGSEHTVTIVGTMQATRLYVDGELVSFLSQKQDQDGLGTGAISTLYSSVLLPLEKIGQDFSGDIANINVYNKALSAEEVAAMVTGAEDDGMVNVAQNAYAGGMSRHTGDGFDNADSRVRVAFKAIDGEAFPVSENTTTAPDESGSEIYSYWKGNHPDSTLTIDLGEERTFSEIQIQWRNGGKGRDFKILVSDDGASWTEAKSVSGNQDFFETIALDEPVTARFVKFQGIASNSGAGTYFIQEFKVMESVDKDALAEQVEAAEALAAEKGITVASTGDAESTFWAALIEARAQLESPLALNDDVARVSDALKAATEGLSGETPEPEPETFVITATAGEGGTITPSGEVEVTEGEGQSFTIAADEGYEIADVVVDGESVGAVESYEFTEVGSDHAIEVTFEKVDEPGPGPEPGDEVDKTELQGRVDELEAEGLVESEYTAESWQAYQDALEDAQAVLDNADATQEQVADALEALNAAYDGLAASEPGTDEPGTDEPGTDEPGTDEPGTDEPGTDEPGTDEPGTDEPGTDEPGTDEPGTDEPGTDEPGTDEPAKTHTVTVVLGNGQDDLKLTVSDKGTLSEPEAPTREGFTFVGWFLTSDAEGNLSDPFDFSTPVTGDLTLYAGWVPADDGSETPEPGDDDTTPTTPDPQKPATDADKPADDDKVPSTGDPTSVAAVAAAALTGFGAIAASRRRR